MDSRKRSYSRSASDKHLIAEQPGMVILISGFLLAFFIGYTTKSLLSPSRVATRIEKAASHIHKDIKVTFNSAHFSLADGILPRIAVIITGVRMESAKECWGAPVLEVDELRLPFSFLNVLRGRGPIKNIEANLVQLNLRNSIKDCAAEEIEQQQGSGAVSAPLVTLTPSEPSTKYRNDISGVYVQKLRITAEKYPQYYSELLNFAVKVKSFEPRVIELTAKSHLLKDDQVGDYLSHANLYMQYKESPEATVQTHFFGNWREGHYSIIANYTIDDRMLAIESDLKHIPLSQILGILQKYNLASKDLNGRQVWISSKARMMGAVDDLYKIPLEVRDLRLEGDLGEMKVDKIDITALEPLKYTPIIVDVKRLDIAKLLVLLNRPKDTSVLGELGSFTGRAEIHSDRKMKMSGEHRGLEFVFSNKGQRETQVIENMVGDISLDGDTWNFQVKRVEPRGGVFIGDVKVKADRDFEEINIKAGVDEISFAAPVQSLMTNGGEIGLVSIDGDIRLKKGQLDFLKGLVRVDAMNVEGMQFNKTKATLDWSHGEVQLNTQVRSLKVSSASAGAGILKQVTEPSWWNQNALTMSDLTGQFQFKSLKNLTWKNFQAQTGKNGRLVTDGSWNEEGRLKGHVHNRDGKVHRRWVIEGTRETPVFVEDKRK
ncbi:hypothetical protein [Bdellovibrio bacteriovorus]|nr:hypothetical protein [Bdellovibrio bacteriovorus]